MKRQLTSILLFSALLVGGASTFVSCTDHESDSAYNTSVSQIAKLTDLNKWLGELKKDYPKLASAIDARIKANMDVIKDSVYADKKRFDAAIQGSEFYQKYQKLEGKVDSIDDRIAAIEELRRTDSIAAKKITDALNHRLDSVSGSLDQALSSLLEQKLDGITVNATENPVTGYWNASFLGLNLKLASSFYGTAVQGYDKDEWGEKIKPNQVLGKDKNAGFLYVSLNPTEIDPSLVKVELVNSQGEPAKGFTLGAIENTNKVLTFGTKAASANGFYQVPVIASDPQNDGVEFDKGALAAAAKNALNELRNPKGNDLDLSKIASALYKNIPVLTAYGVKAEYYLYNPYTKNLEHKTVKHAVSDYDIAAFAVKPVSFNFLENNAALDKLSGWAVENFRLPSLSSKLNKVIDAIKVDLPSSTSKVEVATVLAATDVTVKAENGKVNFYKNGESTPVASYDDATAEVKKLGEVPDGAGHTQYIYKITSKVDAVSNVLADLQNSINGQLEPIKNNINKVGDKWENVIAKVNPLLSKVASKIGSANKLLQPTILYVDKNGNPNTLSTIGGRLSTRFVGEGATTLYPTSWTAELLAPAYLKKVYVEGNPAGAKIVVNGVDQTKDTQFDGSINKVIFNATAGKYTIVYEAIDYSGFYVKKTFNVEVVK